jgi:hypothetical protein
LFSDTKTYDDDYKYFYCLIVIGKFACPDHLEELCQEGHWLLVGLTMLDRSNGRGTGKGKPLVL